MKLCGVLITSDIGRWDGILRNLGPVGHLLLLHLSISYGTMSWVEVDGYTWKIALPG